MSSSGILLYLTGLEPFSASIILVVAPTIAIILLTLLVRRGVGYEKLAANNHLAGIKYGVVGLAYVMLLTFATITAWEKFSLAQTSVIAEASAARAIAAILNDGVKEEKAVLVALKKYLNAAITAGWPEMAREQESHEEADALVQLYKSARNFDQMGTDKTQTASEIFKHIDHINDARETRITLSRGIVPAMMWYVLVAGTLITISFSLFFAGESLFTQVVMTGMTSVVLLMALLVIVAFDHPFTGAVSIDAEPLKTALRHMK